MTTKLSDERRDKIIDDLLFSAQIHSGFNITEEGLDRYEAWLLMQSDVVLKNKLVLNC